VNELLEVVCPLINARIRGIYSTALTCLLLDNDFRVVQPSEAIRERFNLQEKPEDGPPFDLDIHDRPDRQGVDAAGHEKAVNAFAVLLQATLDDAVYKRRLSTYPAFGIPNHQANVEFAPQKVAVEKDLPCSRRRVFLDVEFPGSSKWTLDRFRALATPTLDGHHFYKACGGGISSLLDMAEKMLDEGYARKEVEALFRETIEREFPSEGSTISVEHVKIAGKVLNLGPAKMAMSNRKTGKIQLLRTFAKKGVYDALKVSKNTGDYAVTEMKLGEWSFSTRYFAKDGRYKGTYANINTPIELYPTKIRYVDLEADVCLWPDGRTQKVDRENLDEMVEQGYVSAKLAQIVDERIEEVLNSLSLDPERNSSWVR